MLQFTDLTRAEKNETIAFLVQRQKPLPELLIPLPESFFSEKNKQMYMAVVDDVSSLWLKPKYQSVMDAVFNSTHYSTGITGSNLARICSTLIITVDYCFDKNCFILGTTGRQ
jgi:hypothetical protein